MLGAILAVLITGAGCASTTISQAPATPASSSPAAAPTATAEPSESPSSAPQSPSVAPSPGGFPFAPEAIVGYYESIGYTCTAGQPSPRAPGFSLRTCSLVDPAGRTHDIDVVTGSSGRLEAGVASIKGTSGESILDPSVALEPMAAFAGALLGAEPGAALVPWLAAHLGDPRSETTSGSIVVETYTDAPGVHSTIHLGLSTSEYQRAAATAAP